MNKSDIKIGITCGDINGIGPEIIIKTLADKRICESFTPVIYCSAKVIAFYRKAFGEIDFNYNQVRDGQILTQKINLVNTSNDEVRVEPGVPAAIAGQFALTSLEKACEDLKAGRIHAIVTGPVDKTVLKENGFDFPGHTEYFGSKFEGKPMMLMVYENFRVALMTGHLALSEVSKKITKDLVIEKTEELQKILLRDFGIRKPRIAILGLNPHAGDGGMFGKEEIDAIIPAVEQLKKKGAVVNGPFSADGFFATFSHKKYDAVLAMYHDQGLIPFKALTGAEGVNFTGGLNVIRTSPDHGPAFNIAGKQEAAEESIRNAMYLAVDIFEKRSEYKEISAKPLPTMTTEQLNDLK